MKTIQFNNKKYLIPETWDEVTLDMQMTVGKVTALQPYVQTLGTIAGYTGIPVEDLKNAPIKKLHVLMESLTFMNEDIPTNKDLKWEWQGHKYSVDKNLGEMQFQDFVSIQTIVAEHRNSEYDAIPIIAAVLCKREGETLDDYDPIERSEIFKQMPIGVASSIASFFLLKENYLNLLTNLSSPRLQEDILRVKLNELKRTQSQLVVRCGGKLRMWLLRGILRQWIKSFEAQLTKSYSTTASKSLTTNWKQTFRKLFRKIGRKKDRTFI